MIWNYKIFLSDLNLTIKNSENYQRRARIKDIIFKQIIETCIENEKIGKTLIDKILKEKQREKKFKEQKEKIKIDPRTLRLTSALRGKSCLLNWTVLGAI